MWMLFLDKARRFWAYWPFLAIGGVTWGWAAGASPESGVGSFLGLWWWLVFFPAQFMELGGGYGRVALTLPFPPWQVLRMLWGVAVGLPTIVTGLFAGLGLLLHDLKTGSLDGLVPCWLDILVTSGVSFGASFWLFSGRPQGNRAGRLARHVYGWGFLAAAIGFGIWLYRAPYGHETKLMIYCVPTVVMTVLGWLRSEELLVDYAGYRPGAGRAGTKKEGAGWSSKRGGMSFLAGILLGIQLAGMGTTGAVLAFLGFKSSHWQSWLRGEDPWMWCMLLVPAAIISLNQLSLVANQLRYARTLPVSGGRLVAAMLVIALGPLLSATAIVAALTAASGRVEMIAGVCKFGLLTVGSVCVMTCGLVWYPKVRWWHLVWMGLCMVCSIVPLFYQFMGVVQNRPHLPLPLVITYAVAVVVGTALVLRHLVVQDSMTYRRRVPVVGLAGGIG